MSSTALTLCCWTISCCDCFFLFLSVFFFPPIYISLYMLRFSEIPTNIEYIDYIIIIAIFAINWSRRRASFSFSVLEDLSDSLDQWMMCSNPSIMQYMHSGLKICELRACLRSQSVRNHSDPRTLYNFRLYSKNIFTTLWFFQLFLTHSHCDQLLEISNKIMSTRKRRSTDGDNDEPPSKKPVLCIFHA